jgi:signal transduction histidine kinase
MRSIKTQLTVWLIGLFTVTALLAGVVSYTLTRADTNRLLDYQLRLVAGSIDEGSMFSTLEDRYRQEAEQDHKNDLVMQVWLVNENQLHTSHSNLDLPRMSATGFADVLWRGQKWRSYTIVYPDRTVQVSQADSMRAAIAQKAALESTLPIAGLIPLVWLIVALVVGRVFKPLAAITLAVGERNVSSHDPLPVADLPQEVIPFVVAMNGLVSRLRKAVELQRQFVADAAHELRTPLAALQLQIDSLSSCRNQEDRATRMSSLQSSLYRATHLVNQLLQMARYESHLESAKEDVDLGALMKSCIAEFVPMADQRDVDLGLARDATIRVAGNPEELRVLFNNLIDNAVRYTPAGGRVDILLLELSEAVGVAIQDSGPGIPEHLLPKVYDRFFRVARHEVEGSGIGLSIVKTIAERNSVRLELANRVECSGLMARVLFDNGIVRAE